MTYRFALAQIECKVNVLLYNYKQNITSLSLLVGTTVLFDHKNINIGNRSITISLRSTSFILVAENRALGVIRVFHVLVPDVIKADIRLR